MNESSLGILICLYTGLRFGEICAMKWGDVSFADSSLKVQRTVQRVRVPDAGPDAPRTRLVFDSSKSAGSNRTVPLPGFLLELMFSMRGSDEAFILTGSDRHCLEPRTYQNRFYAILRDAGVRRVNFHTLRHTFATGCVALGGDPKTLCEILGHADVAVTLNVYVHPSIPAKRELVERFSSRGGHSLPTFECWLVLNATPCGHLYRPHGARFIGGCKKTEKASQNSYFAKPDTARINFVTHHTPASVTLQAPFFFVRFLRCHTGRGFLRVLTSGVLKSQ